MWFSCKSILILRFKKCKNFPLGPLKKYLLAWLYDFVLSTTNSVIYPLMVLSNQWSTALVTMLLTLLTFWINASVQTTGGLDLISNCVSANLANHSNNSWWIPLKKISWMSVKMCICNQASLLSLGFLFWASAKSLSWYYIHFWISVFDGNHLDIPSRRFLSRQ